MFKFNNEFFLGIEHHRGRAPVGSGSYGPHDECTQSALQANLGCPGEGRCRQGAAYSRSRISREVPGKKNPRHTDRR